MTTPYDLLIRSAEEKEKTTGWTKLQVTGFTPAAFSEEYDAKQTQKEVDRMNRNIAKRNARREFERMQKGFTATLFREMGRAQPAEEETAIRDDFWGEIGLGYEDADGEEEDEAPDTLAYYRQLPQAEVDNIKFIYMPSAAFDRADVLHTQLCGRPNRDGSYSFSGSGCDSDRMIDTIQRQLEHCHTLLKANNNASAAGFFELFAVTCSSFMLNWWYETYNHMGEGDGYDEHPIVAIAEQFSSLWTRALSLEVCTAAGIEQTNRDAFVAWLQYINTHEWEVAKLAKMDVIYETPEVASKVQITLNE